jgi:hypothetical protein
MSRLPACLPACLLLLLLLLLQHNSLPHNQQHTLASSVCHLWNNPQQPATQFSTRWPAQRAACLLLLLLPPAPQRQARILL